MSSSPKAEDRIPPGTCSTMPPGGRSVFTDITGLTMQAKELGEDKGGDPATFVLVPGLGLSGRYMMPLAGLLASAGKVWVPDLPGCGRSEKPPVVFDIPALADALALWMDRHAIGGAILMGHSLGAQVVVDLAVRYPELVARVVLVSPTMDPAALRVPTQVARLLRDSLEEPLRLYWIAISDYLRAGVWRCLRTLRHALADPVERKLPQLACPVLVISGGRDPIVPQPWVDRLVRMIPDARSVAVSMAAHAVNFNSPDILSEEVLNFMEINGPIPQDKEIKRTASSF